MKMKEKDAKSNKGVHRSNTTCTSAKTHNSKEEKRKGVEGNKNMPIYGLRGNNYERKAVVIL